MQERDKFEGDRGESEEEEDIVHSVPRGGKKSLFDMQNFRHKDSFSSNISWGEISSGKSTS